MFRTIGDGKLRTGETTNAGMDVPKTRAGLGGEIVFDEDGAGLCTFSGNDQVGNFDAARLPGFADLKDRFWV